MSAVHDRLRLAANAIWITIGLIGLVVAAAICVTPLRLDLHSFVAPAFCGSLLAAGGLFYRSVRQEPRLGAILTSTSQIIAFAGVGAPLSYLAATAGFPLQDALFDSWDRQLQFDWISMMSFVAASPTLRLVLLLAYSSFAVQTVTTVLGLGIAGQFVRLSTFVIAFICTTLITIAASAVLPAAGPWLFLDLQPAMSNGFLPTSSTSWPVFLGLRDGTFDTIQGMHSDGIITFPSLHAALSVLFAAALWPVKGVRWAALALNGLMLAATPAYGSHYLIDVIAGVWLAAMCWIAAARFFETGLRKSSEAAVTVSDAPSIVPQPESMVRSHMRELS